MKDKCFIRSFEEGDFNYTLFEKFIEEKKKEVKNYKDVNSYRARRIIKRKAVTIAMVSTREMTPQEVDINLANFCRHGENTQTIRI